MRLVSVGRFVARKLLHMEHKWHTTDRKWRSKNNNKKYTENGQKSNDGENEMADFKSEDRKINGKEKVSENMLESRFM